MKAIGVLFVLFISAYTHSARTIAVEGQGHFTFPAESLRIKFAVYNQSNRDIQQAKANVERASSAIVAALMKLGIQEKDIVSPSFTVDLQEHFDRGCANERVPVVGRDMALLLRDITLYQKVLDSLVNNGATNIGQITSEVANIKKHEQQAMLAAIADAKEQATFLVENLGAKLGKVHSIGQKRIRNSHSIQEVLTTRARGGSKKNDIPYDFKPKPVDIHATIYVEFEID